MRLLLILCLLLPTAAAAECNPQFILPPDKHEPMLEQAYYAAIPAMQAHIEPQPDGSCSWEAALSTIRAVLCDPSRVIYRPCQKSSPSGIAACVVLFPTSYTRADGKCHVDANVYALNSLLDRRQGLPK